VYNPSAQQLHASPVCQTLEPAGGSCRVYYTDALQRGVGHRGSATGRRAGTACLVHSVSRLGTEFEPLEMVLEMKHDCLCPFDAQQLTLIELQVTELYFCLDGIAISNGVSGSRSMQIAGLCHWLRQLDLRHSSNSARLFADAQ
jgi:hypothetical protein